MSDVPGLKQQVADALRISVDGWSDDMLMGAYVALGVARQRGVAIPSRQQDLIDAVREWVTYANEINEWSENSGYAPELAPDHLLDGIDESREAVFEAFEDFKVWEEKRAG